MFKLDRPVVFIASDRLKDNSSETLMGYLSNPETREQVVVLTNLGDDIDWYEDYGRYFTGLICNKDINKPVPITERFKYAIEFAKTNNIEMYSLILDN